MIDAIFRWYRRAATVLVVLGCAGQIAIVFLRNLVNWEPDWILEATTLALVFGSLLFIADAPDHIAFRGLVLHAGRFAPAIRAVAAAITIGAALFLTAIGIEAVRQEWILGGTTPTRLQFPLWLMYAFVPVIAFFSALRQWDVYVKAKAEAKQGE